MAASVLWPAAVPVLLGLAVSVLVGAALGAALLVVASPPVIFDRPSIAAIAGAGRSSSCS